MLIDFSNYKNFEKFVLFLRDFDLKTDKKYTKEIGSVYPTLSFILDRVKAEYLYREKLQFYKSQGFVVDAYLNKTYSTFDKMVSELNQVLSNIINLIEISNKYYSISSKVSDDMKRKFVPLLKQPGRYLEAVNLWNKIKVQIGE